MAIDGDRDLVCEPGEGRVSVSQGHDRHKDVAVGGLHGHARGDQILLDGVAVGSGARQHERELDRIDAGPVEHYQTLDLLQPFAGGVRRSDGFGEQHAPVALEQSPGGVDAGEDRTGRTRRRRRLHAGIEPGGVDAFGPGQHQSGLAPGGQCLVCAGHHRVCAALQRMRRQIGVEAEVRRPRGIDDQGHAMCMGGLRQPPHIPHGADVGGIADEDGQCLRVLGEGGRHRLWRNTEGQSGRGVHLGADPYRGQSGEHESDEQRTVQRAAHDHRAAIAPDGQREGLIGVGGTAGGETADVGSPQSGGPRLGLGKDTGGQLHRVQSPVEWHVAGDHIAHEVVTLLVARDRERRGGRLLEPQPCVQQRGVRA